MAHQQLTYTISLIEKITSPIRKIQKSFQTLENHAKKARAATNRLPLSIADLRGELSALENKRSFSKTTTQVRHLNGVIQKTEKRLRKLENLPPKGFINRINQASTAIAGLSLKDIGIAYAARSLIRFGKESTNLYDIQEKANAQLQSSLKSTGFIAGKTFSGLKAAASALQKKSLFGDEDINNAQGLLLTFTKIRGEVYDRTMPAILDLSQKMGTDLKSSVVQVGKALNDPKTGLTMLSRSGITFSEEQKKGIYELVDAGKTHEAQMLMLDEIYNQFGGSAEAAANAEPIKQMTMAWGDLREKIGGSIARIINKITPPLMKMFNFFERNYSKVVGWIKFGTVAMVSFYTAVKISNVVSKVWARRAAIMRLMSIRLSGGLKGVTRSIRMMNIATKANVIGALVGVIITAISYFKIFRKQTDVMGDSLKKAFDSGSEYYRKNVDYLDQMFAALDKTNPKSKERIKLVDDLLKKFPNLNKEMRDELTNTNDLAKSKAILIEQLKQEAITRGMQAVLQEKAAALAKAELAAYEEEKRNKIIEQQNEETRNQQRNNPFVSETEMAVRATNQRIVATSQKAAQELKKVKKEFVSIEGYIKKNLSSMFGSGNSSNPLAIDASTTTNNPQSQLNTITGGGRSIKNVVINLGSLIAENTNIFKEGETPENAEDFIDKLTTSLQLVVNDTNYAV